MIFKIEHSRRNYGMHGSLSYRSLNNLSLLILSSYNYSNNELQYIGSDSYNNENRYLFAQIERNTLDFTL